MPTRILVPMDDSEMAQHALRYAFEFFPDAEVDESDVAGVYPQDVQSFVRSLRDAEESVSTQRRRLAALRRFYDWLINEGVVTQNPARHPKVKPLHSESDSHRASTLSAVDVEKMVATAGESPRTGRRDQALILTIVYGALRRGEVVGLEVGDLRPLGRYWILDLDDASQGSDYVRIPDTVVEAIDRMKEAYDITKGALWRSLSNQNYGAPMSPDAVYKVVRRVSEQAGLDPVSIDTLRRTGLGLALEGGATFSQVQAHGRFTDSSSAARLAVESSSELSASAAEHIELELEDALSVDGQ